MQISRRMLPVFAGVLVSLLSLSGAALAAPVTVNLRVEGSSSTLFEGPVTTQGEMISTPSSGGADPCNYSENGPSSEKGTSENENGGNISGTPTTALHDAALASGLAFDASWFGSGVSNGNPGDFFVSQVGSDVNQTSSPFDSWGYAVNDTTAPVGGCQIALAPGNEVLWAYNYFNLKHLLSLSGPSNVTVGVPFTVHVTDGQTGEAISGASIGQLANGVTSVGSSSPTTNAAGNATVTLTQTGTVTFKATQSESVRSNGLPVNAVSSTCACAPAVPVHPPETLTLDVAKIAGVKNGHVYTRHSAPRVLAGTIVVPTGGTLRQVRISLQRHYRGRCFDFSGSREKFMRTKKCGSAPFFSVGGSESFSYLLPARLPKGNYVFDIEGVDSRGQTTKLVSGVSHVVFQVK
jgi:hypothetical protein